MLLFCYICPPLAILMMGRPFSAVFNFFLLIAWPLAIKHALVCYADYSVEGGVQRIERAVNAPSWADAVPRRVPTEHTGPVTYNIGVNGTRFQQR